MGITAVMVDGVWPFKQTYFTQPKEAPYKIWQKKKKKKFSTASVEKLFKQLYTGRKTPDDKQNSLCYAFSSLKFLDIFHITLTSWKVGRNYLHQWLSIYRYNHTSVLHSASLLHSQTSVYHI